VPRKFTASFLFTRIIKALHALWFLIEGYVAAGEVIIYVANTIDSVTGLI